MHAAVAGLWLRRTATRSKLGCRALSSLPPLPTPIHLHSSPLPLPAGHPPFLSLRYVCPLLAFGTDSHSRTFLLSRLDPPDSKCLLALHSCLQHTINFLLTRLLCSWPYTTALNTQTKLFFSSLPFALCKALEKRFSCRELCCRCISSCWIGIASLCRHTCFPSVSSNPSPPRKCLSSLPASCCHISPPQLSLSLHNTASACHLHIASFVVGETHTHNSSYCPTAALNLPPPAHCFSVVMNPSKDRVKWSCCCLHSPLCLIRLCPFRSQHLRPLQPAHIIVPLQLQFSGHVYITAIARRHVRLSSGKFCPRHALRSLVSIRRRTHLPPL